MPRQQKAMAGVLGLGKVGKHLLLQHSRQTHSFTINWITDSKNILSKRNREPFSRSDIHKIIAVKNKESHRNYENSIEGCCVYEFDTPAQQLSALLDLTHESLRNWVMLDMTQANADADFQVARNFMGCVAYCTGNKAPWADYELYSRLYNEAKRSRTLLGLNCTAGVWADQMDVIPIVVRALKEGRIDILKRDNSSFNSFFSKVGRGIDSDKAISEISAAGHLEKTGSDALSAEVKDQIYKTRIAANTCGIFRNKKPSLLRETSSESSMGPASSSPADIAAWHVEGRKRGKYPALISEIKMDELELLSDVRFERLPKNDTLARDFPDRCAFSVRAHGNTRFLWSSMKPKSGIRCYTYSDYGGAVKTAAKLLWETERAIALSQLSELEDDHFPFPILRGLYAGQREAKLLQRKLTRSLL